jgi:hypothetical protein
MMTTSPNDNEALSAIRMANKYINSWEKILNTPQNSRGSTQLILENKILRRDLGFLKKAYDDLERQNDIIQDSYNRQVSRLDRRIQEAKKNARMQYYYSLPWYIRWFVKKPS